VIRRCSVAIAAAAVAAVSCLALAPVTPAQGAVQGPGAPWVMPRPGSTYSSAFRLPALAGESGRPQGRLAGCEQKLERDGHKVPTIVIVGASFTAGVGSGNPGKSWAVGLARLLHWDAVIYGDPGAGYVRAGAGRKGPVAAEIARVDLRALGPALVIVQAGHDDIGVPPRLEQRRVEQAVALIRAEAPRARIGLLTVFAGRSPSAAAYRTDHRRGRARPGPCRRGLSATSRTMDRPRPEPGTPRADGPGRSGRTRAAGRRARCRARGRAR
jgi:hypothetical protein